MARHLFLRTLRKLLLSIFSNLLTLVILSKLMAVSMASSDEQLSSVELQATYSYVLIFI